MTLARRICVDLTFRCCGKWQRPRRVMDTRRNLPNCVVDISASTGHASCLSKAMQWLFQNGTINISEHGAAAAILRRIREWLERASYVSPNGRVVGEQYCRIID